MVCHVLKLLTILTVCGLLRAHSSNTRYDRHGIQVLQQLHVYLSKQIHVLTLLPRHGIAQAYPGILPAQALLGHLHELWDYPELAVCNKTKPPLTWTLRHLPIELSSFRRNRKEILVPSRISWLLVAPNSGILKTRRTLGTLLNDSPELFHCLIAFFLDHQRPPNMSLVQVGHLSQLLIEAGLLRDLPVNKDLVAL